MTHNDITICLYLYFCHKLCVTQLGPWVPGPRVLGSLALRSSRSSVYILPLATSKGEIYLIYFVVCLSQYYLCSLRGYNQLM